MVLEWLGFELDGNSWEDLCIDICRIAYSEEFFHEIPANFKGDGGIEGFTKSEAGIVIQCYCPNDPNLDYNSLYESQRDKVTTDIKKIIRNKNLLQTLGVKKICRWIFMIPEYKDRRILAHCQAKQEEILRVKQEDPEGLDYISDEFQVDIKVAADFKTEIARIVRKGITDVKLEIPDTDTIDWENVESEKSENITRKMKAVSLSEEENVNKINKLVEYHVKNYISGKITLEKLAEDYPEIWEDVMEMERAFKNKVTEKTLLSSGNKMNLETYQLLSTEFEEALKVKLEYLSLEGVMTLSSNIVSGWLADCHMEFY